MSTSLCSHRLSPAREKRVSPNSKQLEREMMKSRSLARNTTRRFVQFLLNCWLFPLLLILSTTEALSSTSNTQEPEQRDVILQVCTGPDCRVDGATDCLRMLLLQTSCYQDNRILRVRATTCLGPCGDGPNVVAVNATTGRRMVLPGDLPDARERGSWVPADLFGANVTGVMQVRSARQAEALVRLAHHHGTRSSSGMDPPAGPDSYNRVQSTRTWYDRPRNERLVLQRAMHVSILMGLAGHPKDDFVAWSVAALLWVLSNFVMKESLLESFLVKQQRRWGVGRRNRQ